MRSARASIFTIVAILVGIGIVMIYSASAIYAYGNMHDSLYFLNRHLVYLMVGLVIMLVAMSVDLKKIREMSRPLILLAAALLVLVLVPHVGKEISGAKRWFRAGPVNFQPSEFAKLAMLVFMADL